jgi:hypothetical protein
MKSKVFKEESLLTVRCTKHFKDTLTDYCKDNRATLTGVVYMAVSKYIGYTEPVFAPRDDTPPPKPALYNPYNPRYYQPEYAHLREQEEEEPQQEEPPHEPAIDLMNTPDDQLDPEYLSIKRAVLGLD